MIARHLPALNAKYGVDTFKPPRQAFESDDVRPLFSYFEETDFRKRILRPVVKAGTNDLKAAVEEAMRHTALQHRMDIRHVQTHSAHSDEVARVQYRAKTAQVIEDLYAKVSPMI